MKSSAEQPPQIDRIDRAIIRELRRDGRLTVRDLAARVNLSPTPCHARLKRLIGSGLITGFAARVDHARLGEGHVAFVQVTLSDTRDDALNAFNAAALKSEGIEQCHMIAGSFDYLLKVRTRDIGEYRKVLGEEISRMPHVASTSTFVCMEAVKE